MIPCRKVSVFWVFAWILFWAPGFPGAAAAGQESGKAPVYIGIDAEFGYRDSTSAEAISRGVRIAIDEINRQGGVLGGRPLAVVERSNHSVPARSVVNLRELSGIQDLVAVFCGRFSPPVIAALPVIHQNHLILLDPWAAADHLVQNGYSPNFVFRLSLKDSDAMPVMLRQAQKLGAGEVGLLLLNTSWGRSSLAAAEHYLDEHRNGPRLAGKAWFNWQDQSLLASYQALREAGAEAVVMVTNAETAAVLVNEVAALPRDQRLPILCHWGITGGRFPEMVGDNLARVDLSVVQTFSFVGAQDATARKVLAAAKRLFGLADPRLIPAPVGIAHAYDLTRILARAIDMAGSTDRDAIRNALEQVRDYRGLVRYFARPFTPDRHDALTRDDVFMAYYDPEDHAIVPVGP